MDQLRAMLLTSGGGAKSPTPLLYGDLAIDLSLVLATRGVLSFFLDPSIVGLLGNICNRPEALAVLRNATRRTR